MVVFGAVTRIDDSHTFPVTLQKRREQTLRRDVTVRVFGCVGSLVSRMPFGSIYNRRQQIGCMADHLQTDLLGLSLQQLTEVVEALQQPSYRARQLFEAIYRQRQGSLDDISTLPQSLRSQMRDRGFVISLPRMQRRFESTDGTIRYLVAFADGQSVETVWMPEGDDGEAGDGSDAGDEIPASALPIAPQPELVSIAGTSSAGELGSIPQFGSSAVRQSNTAEAKNTLSRKNWGRATICVSSQIGCAVDCQFCMTALLGAQRNLTPGEIVGQILFVLNDRDVVIDRDRINLVFMGQGEPFLNYANFIAAVKLLDEGVGIRESRMTVSTAGIVPRIRDFGREAVRPKLAISLNAPNDDIRSRVMPINRKWNIDTLLAAARDFPLRNRERLTFEYVLLDGVNDAPEHARELAGRLHSLRAKVNLIALNPGPDIPFGTPRDERVQAFQQILIDAGVPAFIRRPRGRDIYAACGQLKRMAG
jgi:23S rRNA (adenine2503-C2)-methyltransferase